MAVPWLCERSRAEIPSSLVPCARRGWLCNSGSRELVVGPTCALCTVFCSVTVVWSPEKWFFLKHAALKPEFHDAALARDDSRVQTHACVSPLSLRVCANAVAPGPSVTVSRGKEHMTLVSGGAIFG